MTTESPTALAEQTLFSIGFAATAGLAGCMLFSLPLWSLNHSFPVVPILSKTPFLPFIVDTILPWLTVVFLLAALWLRRPWLMGIALGMFTLSVLQDYMRLQPWVYQYLLFLLIVAVGMGHNRAPSALNTLRLILVCMYVYAGIFKLNAAFFSMAGITYFGFMEAWLPQSFHGIAEMMGKIVPFIEIALGVGLLFDASRRTALWTGLMMHFFIIVFICWRLGWNPVIIPWNIAMMAMLMLLFKSSGAAFDWRDITYRNTQRVHLTVALLVVILPLFRFAGMWDTYLSFDLYSYRALSVRIDWEEDGRERFFAATGLKPEEFPEDAHGFRLDAWALNELHVPTYPEPRVLRRIVAQLCEQGNLENAAMMLGTVYREKEGQELECVKQEL